MTESRKRKLPTNSQVVKYNTTGDGNCFFHAVFGEKKGNSDPYRAERAQDMRMEWHKFLSQFTSLDDVSMPDPLRAQLEKVFDAFLNTPRDLTGKSKKMKGLAERTNKKIEEADSKTRELKEEIVKNFRDDGDFRKVIYPVIERAINERNERNIDSPRDQKTLLSVENLLKEENKERLYDDITEDLESCALILNPNFSEKEYGDTYDPKVIKDSFFNDEVLYKAYLEAIESKSYFPFVEEVQILASLANIEINVHCEVSGREKQQKFEPDPQMINNDDQLNQVFNRESYKLNDELWGSKERETIYLGGNHYSRAEIVTQELIRQQQEQEDFLLAKKLQLDEILEYCNLSKDIPERAEVEKGFDKLLAENADGKIGDVVGQCVSDIKQRIERSEKQNPSSSPRCSMEESRTEKTFHQQQISQLEV
ncbi:hypothetical protein OZD61_01330 [Wolbachia endosymbiont of Drosophila bocki]|uniref:hypothetical protein n=1 Tax=Wolbachia endosymbiont of Drosophila bocki TaxID=3002576 RepID=UPI0023AA09C7|nr:hypothetical protein [Wolbachia endosymbiont of Drosophila bocki]MDE5057448.1 hypothetical protein [Wolbachia endosymbiont of Drosophila bocki]